jgi:hypothetical protein
MDIHSVITTAVEEVLHGVTEAKKQLTGKATVGFPNRIEVEVGITSTYEIANYDDVRIATVRVGIPIFQEGEGATESPASEAAAKTATKTNGKKSSHK